jgi:DeoR/GlpR family transcriptional regulator of sugar metabolism
MLEAAGKVYLAVDSSKFDKVAFSRICPLTRIDVVITDKRPDERWLLYFEEYEIECIYPEEE